MFMAISVAPVVIAIAVFGRGVHDLVLASSLEPFSALRACSSKCARLPSRMAAQAQDRIGP
jgi:hypothetical protein